MVAISKARNGALGLIADSNGPRKSAAGLEMIGCHHAARFVPHASEVPEIIGCVHIADLDIEIDILVAGTPPA
ncbi:hypothetical protein CVO77_08555 [Sphingopyxis lindanitolerans]|uniref:Uncharacterized protein n=1 Tax=Sphingopyxis lindanitolerans TaxID=2054227 RepID=A0A2S8B7W9_9SPHN|nr:hypothetical protein CVO77_08555 [Sphingopyxis lindanitolerans]